MARTERRTALNLHSPVTFRLEGKEGEVFTDGCSDLLDDFLKRIRQLESEYLRAMVRL
ncbi:hypothetical protein [Streptomyces malaysiense]|uniref:hypothetical protein n=1 Tax=Streptomyces malaysiense TaxID=1428626 RepID=UPI000A8CA1A1|nr:hypothetical protein [Streptomyces malaysiense]